MQFFKNLLGIITGLFKKKSPSTEKIILEEKIVLSEAIDNEIIFAKIEGVDDEKEKEGLFEKIAKQDVAKDIIENLINITPENTVKKKGRKFFYELHELRFELLKLYIKKAKLEFLESKINLTIYPDTSSIDIQIDDLFKLLNKNKNNKKIEISKFTISSHEQDIKKLEKLLSDKSTLKSYNNRERENKKQREIYENKIKKEFQNLDLLLTQNNFDEAKVQINRLSKSIKPDYKKGIERLSKAIDRLKEKEIEVFKKRHLELLKQQEVEAETIRIEQKKIEEKRREAKENREALIKLDELKNLEKENRLKALLNKKANWRDFRKVLQDNNISILYHFTDHSNLKSIKDNGGLYSWFYCDRNNIVIPMTGNSSLGRSLDIEFGLEDYVRLSFIKDHPMKHVAMSEGRITKPYLLKVSPDVCYFENTRFSDMNAADRRHKNDNSLDFLSTLKFDLFEKKYFNLSLIEKKQHQAEVLIKTWIPAEYITNLNEIF
jgi:hypothetical protein